MTQQRQWPHQKIWDLAGQAAVETPPGRDRVVDLLRGGSLAVVVLGHILMAVVVWEDGIPEITNLLATRPVLQPATWVLQVMPLFFAAGAVANRASWLSAKNRGEPWQGWVWARVARLARPVIYYLAVWVPLVMGLTLTLGDAAAPLARLSTQLLWFLGVYVIVVAATPMQVRLAEKGPVSILALFTVVVLLDVARFHLADAFSLLNFVIVWVMTATLGLVVRDRVKHKAALWTTAAIAVALNSAVVHWGPYPLSMVGMPGERISNMAPPTVALTLHAVAMICVIGACWGGLKRFCERPRIWHATCALGATAMSLYLWHLTALIAVTVVAHLVGLERPPVDNGWFWAATVLWSVVCLIVVVGVVSITAPLEYIKVPGLEKAGEGRKIPATRLWCGIGVVILAVGLLAVAATGMFGFPFTVVATYMGVALSPGLALLVMAVGLGLVRTAGRSPTTN